MVSKKILTLCVVGVSSISFMVGCSNGNTKDTKETVIIKYQDQDGNTIKEKEVTKEEVQKIKEENKTNQQSNKNNQQTKENKENTIKDKSNTKKKTSKVKDETNLKEASKFYYCDKCGKSVSNKNKEYFPYCYNCYIRIKKQVENMNKEDEEVKKEEPKEKEDDYKLDVPVDEPKDEPVEIFQCNKCGGNAYYVDTLGNKHCLSCERNKDNSDSGQEPLRDPENDIQE